MSYATLTTRFDLPSPPPKSVFSTVHNEAGRAWFPDFTQAQDPVSSLRDFVKNLFYPTFRSSTFVQLKVVSVITAIIGISIFLIILRRLYERSFWLFRLVKRSNGTLIVPNAVTSFVAVESTFAILLIALCWEVVSWYQYGQSPKYMILWIGLTWLPLILGAWCTTVGIIYARPNALSFVSPHPTKTDSWALRMGITPAVVNVTVFLIPVVQTVTVVVPAVLAQRRFSEAFDHYHRWSAALQPGQGLTRDLLLEAQQIWFKVLDAAYFISICMAIWEAWVCALFICYCLAGGALINTLRRQIKTLKSFQQNRFGESFAVLNADPTQLRRPSEPSVSAIIADAMARNDVDVEKQPVDTSSPPLFAGPVKPRSLSTSTTVSENATLVSREASMKRKRAGSNALSATTKTEVEGGDDTEAQTQSMYFTHEELEDEDRPSNSFFPAVRPSAFERPAKARSPAGKQTSQKRYLEKFYNNFVVQFVGLMLCILFFAIFCGKLITTWYSAWEANDLGPALQIALLVVVWVTIILASVIIFAILGRTYEPVLSNIGSAAQGRSDDDRCADLHKAGVTRKRGGSLTGAKEWAASHFSKERHGQSIGMGDLPYSRRQGRSATLSGPPSSMLHYAELTGGHSSPRVDLLSVSPKSQPRPFGLADPRSSSQADGTHTRARSVTEPRRKRSLRSSDSVTKRKGSVGGVVVEQTVSTIIEDPAVEEHYLTEQDCGSFAASSSRPGSSWLTSLDSMSNGHSTSLTGFDPEQKQYWDSLLPRQPDRVLTAREEGEDFVLVQPGPKSSRLSRPGTCSSGLGLMTGASPWSAPLGWNSPEPDMNLVREDADRRSRIGSHSSNTKTQP
ncbi:hypothetical protein PSEUBRA_004345 [Kalmanozyma brasiliensis GHG001]|uniref:Uncharacterized protein n=1 Tax=Kalmanozyma brasiliensis (strain GHG001) TaxID=1365824 RepID=V5EMT7_KALBG|nr:uncharacterized protein PSEUBRA_004345 [Kalmanozyma brasiliensis GHG001]EST06445.1 hypothetical protein PSEUBRA_004345 [Kalmanozyma brasiliensis GHG001]